MNAKKISKFEREHRSNGNPLLHHAFFWFFLSRLFFCQYVGLPTQTAQILSNLISCECLFVASVIDNVEQVIFLNFDLGVVEIVQGCNSRTCAGTSTTCTHNTISGTCALIVRISIFVQLARIARGYFFLSFSWGFESIFF